MNCIFINNFELKLLLWNLHLKIKKLGSFRKLKLLFVTHLQYVCIIRVYYFQFVNVLYYIIYKKNLFLDHKQFRTKNF